MCVCSGEIRWVLVLGGLGRVLGGDGFWVVFVWDRFEICVNRKFGFVVGIDDY